MKVYIREECFKAKIDDIISAMKKVEPEKVINYFVKIGDKIYPPKQVITEVLKIHKVFFTTLDAIEVLESLGFNVGWLDKKTGRIMIYYNDKTFNTRVE